MLLMQMKKLPWEDFEDLYKLVKARYGLTRPVESMNYLLWSDIVGIKSLFDAVGITAAKVYVNTAQLELVLLVNFNEKYTKCLLLLVEVKTVDTKVNAARKVKTTSINVNAPEEFNTDGGNILSL
nr:hypothetical protein [Tanacetum cinerariifolium]